MQRSTKRDAKHRGRSVNEAQSLAEAVRGMFPQLDDNQLMTLLIVLDTAFRSETESGFHPMSARYVRIGEVLEAGASLARALAEAPSAAATATP